jgi:hypothetical protein
VRAICLAVLWCVWVSTVGAQQPCGADDRPWVSLRFTWDESFETYEAAVVADLGAGFRGRDIDVCLASSGPEREPIASVELSTEEGETATVSVEIRDTVTQKRVARDVDLSRVPSDGRAFAIAVATDELVWASWAELALERSVRAQRKPPPEVERAVKRDLPKPISRQPERDTQLGARGVFEWFGGGQRYVGADATLGFLLLRFLQLDVGAGLRQGTSVASERGSIESSAISVSSALRVVWLTTDGLRLGSPTGARLAWVNLQGNPNDAAEGSEFTGALVVVRSGLDLDVRLASRLWFNAGVTAGLPVRSVKGTDDGRDATGASEVELAAVLGLGVEL